MKILHDYKQWVLFRTAKDQDGKTISKAPISPKDYRPARVNAPSTWTTYETAKEKCVEGYGLGFVLTEGTGIVGIDLDHVIDSHGKIEPWAVMIIEMLQSYTEISPSGTGVHIYIRADLKSTGKPSYKVGQIEIYETGRYFTVTENPFPGYDIDIREAQEQLNDICDRLLQGKPIDPSMVLRNMTKQESDPKVQDLLRGEWKDYYPSQSEADLALCGIIADYAGNDAVLIDQIFRKTGLYRDKWDESRAADGKTYGELTIEKAVELAPAGNQEWPELMKFTVPEVPEFPVDCLPEWARDYVTQLSQSMQTPVDLAGSIAMAMLAYPISSCVKIAAKSDWVEMTNLYIITAMPPASRKSPVLSHMMQPLYYFQQAARDLKKQEIENAAKDKKLKEIKLERAKKALDKVKNEELDGALNNYNSAKDEYDAIIVPKEPRYFADDVTTEQLGVLMSEHNNGVFSIFSAEASDVLSIAAGRYSGGNNANIGIYLKAHCGDPISVDRVNRPAIYVENPALTIGAMAQPEVIEKMKDNSDFANLGLIQRMLIAIPPSNLGQREQTDFSVDMAVGQRYFDKMTSLIERCFQNTDEQIVLLLSPVVYDRFRVEREHTEKLIGEYKGNSLVVGWLGKRDGLVLRLAAVLHVATQDYLPLVFDFVQLDTMEKAIRIADYYFLHFLKVADMLQSDKDTKYARIIAEWLCRSKITEFSRRDCHHALQSIFPKAEYLINPLAMLTERGYIRVASNASVRSSGRPSERYEVNSEMIA